MRHTVFSVCPVFCSALDIWWPWFVLGTVKLGHLKEAAKIVGNLIYSRAFPHQPTCDTSVKVTNKLNVQQKDKASLMGIHTAWKGHLPQML